MTLEEKQGFYDRCNKADWFYDYSDDHSAWQRGRAEMGQLNAEASEDPEKDAIYQSFYNYHFTRDSDGKPVNAMPERPS